MEVVSRFNQFATIMLDSVHNINTLVCDIDIFDEGIINIRACLEIQVLVLVYYVKHGVGI